MERFIVSPFYRTDRMIYRDEAFKLQAATYHRWRSSPADLVGYYLERDIRESGLFKAVLPFDSRLPSSYLIEGSVEDFYEQDEEKGWKAVLGLSITLMAEEEPNVSDRILFQKSYRENEPCAQKNPKGFALAMSQAMSRASEKILVDLHEALKKRQ
jgi:cholesterol transport system auxiliary component